MRVGEAMDAPTHARVRAVYSALEQAAVPGLLGLVPAYTGIAVYYDPLAFAGATLFAAAAAALHDTLRDLEDENTATRSPDLSKKCLCITVAPMAPTSMKSRSTLA